MEYIACTYCGSTNSKKLFTSTDLLLERNEVQSNFVQCQSCGLIYQNPRPTRQEMKQHYPAEYESYVNNYGNRNLPWLLEKAYTYGISKRRKIVTRSKKIGRILDVGCATGSFLLGMKELPGWEVFGVEISPHAANIARMNGLDVYIGTLEEANFSAASFDVVTLWDVLEHLHDPILSLGEIYRILKPEGTLVVRIPNGSSRDAKCFGKTWAGWDAPRHLYVFTISTVKKILKANGFQISQMSCEIGSYPTFVLSVRFWLYNRNVDLKTRTKITRLLYHPITRILSAPLFYILGLRLKGPLLTVTATKGRE